jgi:AcrR family transcriptional regulator
MAMPETVGHHQRAAETKRRRTRAALLDAAGQVFAERGWHDTRMEDIAERSGLSLATTYTYFKNKRTIMGHTYHPYFVELDDKLTTDLVNLPAVRVLEQLVYDLSDLVRQKPTLTVAMLMAAREETVRNETPTPDEPGVRQLVALTDLMVACLQRAQDNGEIPATLSVRDIGSYHTNALLLRVFIDPDETAESTAELVLSQIRPVLGVTATDVREDGLQTTSSQG